MLFNKNLVKEIIIRITVHYRRSKDGFTNLKFFFVLLIIPFCCEHSSGQIILNTSPVSKVVSNTYYESTLRSLGINNKKNSSLTVNPIYLNDSWERAEIYFVKDNTVVPDLLVKLNLSENFVEIFLNNEIKILPPDQVFSIYLVGEKDTIISHKTLKIDDPTGFYKLLYNNKVALLCYYSREILAANYNITMDVGRKTDELIIKKQYYIYSNGGIIKIDDNKKKFINQFNFNKELINYIKKEKISSRNETELIKFIQFYETII
jgi:hypothetical protein